MIQRIGFLLLCSLQLLQSAPLEQKGIFIIFIIYFLKRCAKSYVKKKATNCAKKGA